MATKISKFVYNLTGIVTQVTEWRWSIPVNGYDSLSKKVYFVPTCPVFAGPVTIDSAHRMYIRTVMLYPI